MSAKAIRKILIIGPSWVGDMVMAQSLFIALKQENPAVIIDVLALAWTRPLLERMPEVNEAIPMPIPHGRFAWRERKELGQSLKSRQYDQAIVLPNSWKSALIPWFAEIPLRTGWRGECRYGLINDMRKLDKMTLPMMVQRYVSLAYPASQSHLAPSYPPPKMLAKTTSISAAPSLNANQKRLVICPGAEFGPAKQWPTASYADVANALLERGWQVLVLGSAADRETGKTIVSAIDPKLVSDVVDLTGKTQLEEAIDLLATADYVISNDSGLMHIAAALQRPLIAVYGPTSPDFTPPLAHNAHILQEDVECGPCFQRVCPEVHHQCMTLIRPSTVISKVLGDNAQN
jgi:heptosyltransferase-2